MTEMRHTITRDILGNFIILITTMLFLASMVQFPISLLPGVIGMLTILYYGVKINNYIKSNEEADSDKSGD